MSQRFGHANLERRSDDVVCLIRRSAEWLAGGSQDRDWLHIRDIDCLGNVCKQVLDPRAVKDIVKPWGYDSRLDTGRVLGMDCVRDISLSQRTAAPPLGNGALIIAGCSRSRAIITVRSIEAGEPPACGRLTRRHRRSLGWSTSHARSDLTPGDQFLCKNKTLELTLCAAISGPQIGRE